MLTGLVGIASDFDSTVEATALFLLLFALQNVSAVAEHMLACVLLVTNLDLCTQKKQQLHPQRDVGV